MNRLAVRKGNDSDVFPNLWNIRPMPYPTVFLHFRPDRICDSQLAPLIFEVWPTKHYGKYIIPTKLQNFTPGKPLKSFSDSWISYVSGRLATNCRKRQPPPPTPAEGPLWYPTAPPAPAPPDGCRPTAVRAGTAALPTPPPGTPRPPWRFAPPTDPAPAPLGAADPASSVIESENWMDAAGDTGAVLAAGLGISEAGTQESMNWWE